MAGDPEPMLSAEGVVKTYGATRALRGADLALLPGEVHALLGENGAGKSTLVRILVGAAAPDAGTLRFCGRPIAPGGVRDAVRLGIVPIYQHLSLMPHLSVLDNLFAFEWAGGRSWRGPPRRMSSAAASDMLRRVGLGLDPRLPVGDFSLAERQLVEIARGVARDCAVLVLDEPTAALNRVETDRLFAVVRALCGEGRAVLFISHNLGEVEEIADRVSVLRDGVTVLRGAPRGGVSRRDLIEQMVGRSVVDGGGRRLRLPAPAAGREALRAERIGAGGVDLTVGAGEILGIVGLMGSGARELGRVLAGLEDGGGSARLTCDGRPIPPGDRRRALRSGIGLVPGERESEGLFPGRSVLENASAGNLGEVIARRGWLPDHAAEAALFAPWLRRLAVVPDDVRATIGALSGGNQQKVLLARNLAARHLKVLVAIDPTRGVDVGARETIHRVLVDAAAGGAGVVVVTSDLEEAAAVCHRVLVMREGRIAAELPGDADPGAVLRALTGGTAA